MKLSLRLQAIADMVPYGVTLADIGTDHALLPMYLVEQKIVTSAIAGDVHQGPYLSARNAVAAMHLDRQISVCLGNGLDVVRPNEADVVVIAGMGGTNIIDILSCRPEVTKTIKMLILQPMIAAALVRNWLSINGWRLVAEQLVQEDGRLYQILAARPGESLPVDPVLNEIGPLLWQSRHSLLKPHIQELINQLQGIVAAMRSSAQATGSAKYQENVRKLTALEEKLSCL